jgi:hypothetical protein
VPPPLAAELLRGYDTAARVSLRAAIALDDLAVAIDAPSGMLAAARTPARPPASRSDVADGDNVHQQALAARSASATRPEAGPTEHILRSLQITEPGMLLRAAAIDDAGRDLVANANASSRHRDSLNHPGPRQIPKAAGQAARMAATDLPRTPADRGQHVRLEAPVADAPPGRVPRTALQNSRNHSPAN